MVPPISIGRQSFPRYPLATARQHAATLQIESSLRLPIGRPLPVYLVSVPRDSKAGYLPDPIHLQVTDYVPAEHNGLLALQTASSKGCR